MLLRFFEECSFGEIGAALGTSEDAARMRLNRAVERLRRFYAKEGVAVSAAILLGLLTDRVVQAAPVTLSASAAQIADSASAGSVPGSISAQVHSQLQGTLKAMTISKLKLAATIVIGTALAGSLPFVTQAQNHARHTHDKLAASAPQAVPTPQSKSVMTFFDKAVQAESGVQTGRLNLYYTFLNPKDTRSSYSETSSVVFDNRRQAMMVQGTQNKTGTQVRRRFSADAYQTFTYDPRLPQTDVTLSKPEGYWPPFWPYDILRRRQWESWKSLVSSGKLKAVMVSSDPSTGQAILKLGNDDPASDDQKLFVDTRHGYTLTRLQLLDKASGHKGSVLTIKYKRYAGGYWYPETIEHKSADGLPILVTQKWSVSGVEINPSLAERDLSFGPIPAGANVRDSRVNKSAQAK